ncbi:unnamed protein product [Closterium sp. NIES-53]
MRTAASGASFCRPNCRPNFHPLSRRQSVSPPLSCAYSSGVAAAVCSHASLPSVRFARSSCSCRCRAALGAARRSRLHAGRCAAGAWGDANSNFPVRARAGVRTGFWERREGDSGSALSGGGQRSHWRGETGGRRKAVAGCGGESEGRRGEGGCTEIAESGQFVGVKRGDRAEEAERVLEGEEDWGREEEEEEEEGVTMVIIGAGRIGQAFMQMAPPDSALFLPRGMPLSSLVQLSPRHSQGPIVVATHNCHLDDVLAQVPPARHSDLVLVQNGMLDGWLAEHRLSHTATCVLLYMAANGAQKGAAGVDAAGREKGEEGTVHESRQSQQQNEGEETEGAECEPRAQSQNQLPVCFTSSPRYPHGVRITDGGGRSVATGRSRICDPVLVGGRLWCCHCCYSTLLRPPNLLTAGEAVEQASKWAPLVARLLSASSVPCVPVAPSTFRELSGEKLLWSCIFWLLCAARGGAPLGEVVSADRGTVRALVGELWPLLVGFWREGGSESGGEGGEGIGTGVGGEEGEYEAMCERLCAYSMAIPAVVPSMPMALAEFPWRNGWFMRYRPTPLHTRLLASLLPLYPDARDVILPYLPAGEASRLS